MKFEDRYVAVKSIQTTYGSMILRSLQNDHVPDLDLLVRESVQNASDAGLGEDGNFVAVDFIIGDFDPTGFGSCLTGAEDVISDRFGAEKGRFLAIRDRKTSGLTGPDRPEDLPNKGDNGNFWKLIYDVGQNQRKKASGGNWGYGKSVYYRVGASGIVVYYTRIRSGADGFEERLIATLIENEEKDDALVLSMGVEKPAGRVWWGDALEGGGVVPVKDPERIGEFLGIFGLDPYKGEDTGTTVIVPFLDEGRLLGQVLPEGIESSEGDCFVWKNSVSEYLELAVWKWYAPRLVDPKTKLGFGQKRLRVTVRDTAVSKKVSTLEPKEAEHFFRVTQHLYLTAMAEAGNIQEKPTGLLPGIEVESKTVELTDYKVLGGKRRVGAVAVARASRLDLNGGSLGASPYSLTGNFENRADTNEPIVMFAREPGMVIDYSISHEWWKAGSAPKREDDPAKDEIVLAFFVPSDDVGFEVKGGCSGVSEQVSGCETFCDYLRACEQSDHMSWEDKSPLTLVKRVKDYVKGAIKDVVQPPEPIEAGASASRLAGKLGKMLLPAVGKKKRPGGSGGGGGGQGGGPFFRITGTEWSEGGIAVGFELSASAGGRRVSACVKTEAGSITPEAWAEKVGTAYPISIVKAEASAAHPDGTESVLRCDRENPVSSSSGLSITIDGASLVFASEAGWIAVRCWVVLSTTDKTAQCTLKAE